MKLPACAVVCLLTACGLASSNDLRPRLDAIRQKLPEQKKTINNFRAAGRDVSFPLVTYTVLENFTTYALDDLNTSVPNGWGFLPVNGAAARYEPVGDAHTGQWAARLINKTAESPNVYGMFEDSIGATLGEGKTYTLSVWAKSNQPVNASLTINASWSERLNIETTGGSLKR